MEKPPHEEWLKQADYDMDSAEYMRAGGRNFYAVFLCHLSIEKALKGLYQAKLAQIPPRTHNLAWLLREIGIQPPSEKRDFLVRLNESSVATRYPEELAVIEASYTRQLTRDILRNGKELLQWIKTQF